MRNAKFTSSIMNLFLSCLAESFPSPLFHRLNMVVAFKGSIFDINIAVTTINASKSGKAVTRRIMTKLH